VSPNCEAIGTPESSITPQRLSRFGFEVDEALWGGGRFLGESDAGEAELAGCRQNQKASNKNFSSSQRGLRICPRRNLFLAMGPPLEINYTNTILAYGPILRGHTNSRYL